MKTIMLGLVVVMLAAAAMPMVGAQIALVQNTASYFSSDHKVLYIVGEVLNTGTLAMGGHTLVSADLKDSKGTVIDTITIFLTATYLPSRSRAPFQLTESNPARIQALTSYQIKVDYKPAEQTLPDNLAIQNTNSSIDSQGHLDVLGQVRNTGIGLSYSTVVVGTFYDANGTVAFVATSPTTPDTVPQAGTGAFKLTVNDAGQIPKIKSWSLFAQSQEFSSVSTPTNTSYTNVPETPWPTLMLTLALTLGLVVLRRKIPHHEP
ncbi:MAG: hypothetical protein ABSF82_14825 [Candidatus Bathyarchaeia archaeon]